MKRVYLVVIVLFGYSCFAQNNINQQINNELNRILEKTNAKNALLQVYSPSKELNLRYVALDSMKGQAPIEHTAFYMASITKMFTAVSIGILKDLGKLNFEDKIHHYLPDTLINNLHIHKGIDYTNELRIDHLLQHKSGLPDYFTDVTREGTPNVIQQVLVYPDKNWRPHELIGFTKQNMSPLFAPGDGYHYSDTGYVLLALIIEELSGMPLDAFFKKYIFMPLMMNHSYVNLKSDPKNQVTKLANFYAADVELSSLKSLSADWGGGGMIATTQDLIQFFEAYNNGRILKEETRKAMQNWVHETVGMEYGYGIRKISFGKLLGSESKGTLIGHTGSTASFLWYCPELDTYFAGSLNQLEASKSALQLMYNITKLIQNAYK